MKPIAVIQRVLPFFLAGSACFAEDLAGRVKLSSGDTAEIVLASALLPSVNDKVDIFFKQRGGQGELLVGSGRVTEVGGDIVRMKIERATGMLTKEHYVKIHSPNPQKRKAGAPPVVRELAVEIPPAISKPKSGDIGGIVKNPVPPALMPVEIAPAGPKPKPEGNGGIVKNSIPPALMPVEIRPGTSKPAETGAPRAADAVEVEPPKSRTPMASAREERGTVPPAGGASPGGGKTAKDHYSEGLARHKAGDRDAAIAAYTRAIEADPDYAAAYYSRACIYLVMKDHDGLISDATRALDLGHKLRANLFCFRGTGWAGKGDWDKALKDHNAAIGIDPTYALAYNNRGNDYYHKRDLDRAVKDCDKSIELDPSSPLPWYNRGYMNYTLLKYSSAIADWQKALELQPEYAAELEPLIKKLANK